MIPKKELSHAIGFDGQRFDYHKTAELILALEKIAHHNRLMPFVEIMMRQIAMPRYLIREGVTKYFDKGAF